MVSLVRVAALAIELLAAGAVLGLMRWVGCFEMYDHKDVDDA